MAIFRVPRYVPLPEDKEMINAIDNYSKDEDSKLDNQLDQLRSSIENVINLI